MLQSLGLPVGSEILVHPAVVQLLQVAGTIVAILLPITRMLSAHRKSINDRIEGLQNTLNRRVEELVHTMAEHELDDERRFGQVRTDIDTTADVIRRDFGETATAIRTHMHQIELRDGERRLEIEKQLQETRHTLYGRIDQRTEIIDEKVDEVAERVRQLEMGGVKRGGH